jgi:hypothetical protein
LFRLRHGHIVEERHHAVELCVVPVQAREIQLRQLHRSDLSGSDKLRQLCDGQEGNVFQIGGPLDARSAEVKGLPDPVHLHAWRQRAEVKRRRHIVRNVHFPKVFIARQILIRRLKHGAPILFGKSKSGERERIGQHRLRDALRAILLQLRPQHARQQSSAQPNA